MPYWFEICKIKLPKEKDRRRKLTDEEKEEIKELYRKGWSIRKIAKKFQDKCSRRLVQFILFPERYKHSRINWHWRNYYNKEKHAKIMKEYRRYKAKILKNEKN